VLYNLIQCFESLLFNHIVPGSNRLLYTSSLYHINQFWELAGFLTAVAIESNYLLGTILFFIHSNYPNSAGYKSVSKFASK